LGHPIQLVGLKGVGVTLWEHITYRIPTEIINNNKATLKYGDHRLILFCEIFSNASSINIM
jgi:hypothetical protein